MDVTAIAPTYLPVSIGELARLCCSAPGQILQLSFSRILLSAPTQHVGFIRLLKHEFKMKDCSHSLRH